MRIFLTGFMGSGKSYVGKELSQLLDIPFFDLDEEIEKQEGKSIAKIFETFGEDHFRKLEQKCLQLFIANNENALLSTGGGTPCFFDNSSTMLQNGFVVFLDTSVEILISRLESETNKRPLLKGKSQEELYSFISKKLEARLPFYNECHIVLEQKTKDVQSVKELQEYFLRISGK